MVVMDELHIQQIYPNLCLAAFILEWANGYGKLLDPLQNQHWQVKRTEVSFLV
jgi:hypothetical protein